MNLSRRERFMLGGILCLTFFFLAARALSPARWSWWDFGDCQTMMASTVFADEGFLATRFLWVPQPASPIAKFLDDPAVSHHAHGSTGEAQYSGLGPRRIYTHWPSWYSIPYGILAKLGLLHKGLFQIWASLLSVVSLLFLYLFVRNLLSPAAGLLCVLTYVLSPEFLGYADSLATMPYDDFFRFAFLWCWSIRRDDRQTLQSALLPGALFFGAMLTALDSFAFIPIAAVASDLLARRKFQPRAYAVIALFGIAAMGIQLVQNAAYLGVTGAWLDWKGYFLHHGGLSPVERAVEFLNFLCRALNLPLIPALLFVFVIFFFGSLSDRRTFGWLSTLALAGIAFPAILPGKASMAYETRQLMPFIVFGIAVTVTEIEKRARKMFEAKKVESGRAILVALYFFSLILSVGNFYGFSEPEFSRALDFPASPHIERTKVAFFEKIDRDLPRPKVFIQVDWVLKSKPYALPGYGQAHPIDEWYSRGIVLTVPSIEGLGKDLGYFWSKAPNSFEPIVLMKDLNPNLPLVSDAQLKALGLPWRIGREWRERDVRAFQLVRTD